MRKQHKHYKKPRKPFESSRIEEEKAIVEKYGLKNKRELWKAENFIDRIRSQAKKLIVNPEQQHTFLSKLASMGFIQENAGIDDVLALTREKLLERRLQTVVFNKGFANTPKQARQLITHKKIIVGERIVTIPSYIVKKEEEDKISVVKKKTKEKEKGEKKAKES